MHGNPMGASETPSMGSSSSVLGIVCHYRCEEWLADALEGLTRQTRPLDGIVVVDDGSEEPPVDIVRRYPQVTLLSSAANVGPYRLKQQVIDDTGYDAYLFEDADDWSSPDRVELQLRTAERTGAELVGSYEIQVVCRSASAVSLTLPTDVNEAMALWPRIYPLVHPASMVARGLVQRLGGFASGLRVAGDTEFLLRAHLAGRIVNVPRFCHFRRVRPESLTTARDSGIFSAVRVGVHDLIRDRTEANAAAVQRGEAPDLTPLSVARPLQLTHVLGPELVPASGRARVTPRPLPPVATKGPYRGNGDGPRLRTDASVLALVAHYRCENLLPGTIMSLMAQSRPPDAIAVVDLGSPRLPRTLRSFPNVTLVTSAGRDPRQRVLAQMIEETRFDAYLFQDAGDWSAPHRLEVLLAEAERTGASLVGSHVVHADPLREIVRPMAYPHDVNTALDTPAEPLFLRAGALASRELMLQLGASDVATKNGGDDGFLRRACGVARVVNVPQCLYIRRRQDIRPIVATPAGAVVAPVRLAHVRGPDLRCAGEEG
jgi:glycosyl transferase family 2